MKISDFFQNEVCDFASYDNYRKIASCIDSFKPSQRKIIFTVIKNNVSSPKKVSTLKSDAASQTQYLHGDQSLEGVIVGLAQNFTGSNNIPLLKREGTFGNRLIPVAAASRYIFTCKEDYVDKIFKKDDSSILIEQIFEGDVIEPKFYVPIIPLLAINGSVGLTTGFTQKILPHDVNECIKYIEAKLNNEQNLPKLIPSFNGFTGTVTPNTLKNDGTSWIITGKYNKISSNEIEIVEVPIGYTLEDYTEVLDELEDKKLIKDYKDLSDDGQFKFRVRFFRGGSGLDINDKDLLNKLKLVTAFSEIYTSLDENNKIVEYKSIYEIIDHYYDVRLDYYEKRKTWLIDKLTNELKELTSKYTFIDNVVNNKIIVSNKNKDEIVKQIESFNTIIKVNDSYDYLVNMPIHSLTCEQIKKLKDIIKTMSLQIKEIKSTSAKEMWKKDLNEFKKTFEK